MKPEIEAKTTLSLIICFMITIGVAPSALLIPISWVLSRTVTNIILLTPTIPANKVPKPTIHINVLIPPNSIEKLSNISFKLNEPTPSLSVGDTLLRSFKKLKILGSSSDILTAS